MVDVIDKNMMEIMPRSNLHELWNQALTHSDVTGTTDEWNAAMVTALQDGFDQTAIPTEDARRKPTVSPALKGEARASALALLTQYNSMMADLATASYADLDTLSKKYKAAIEAKHIVEQPSDELTNQMHATTAQVWRGSMVLVKDRSSGTPQPTAVLQRTDSSLVSVNATQGLAGVYEIRNPFTAMLPTAEWYMAVAAYEALLDSKGVSY